MMSDNVCDPSSICRLISMMSDNVCDPSSIYRLISMMSDNVCDPSSICRLISMMSDNVCDPSSICRLISMSHVDCRLIQRMGSVNDGGWDLCTVPPFTFRTGCLVYSFGSVACSGACSMACSVLNNSIGRTIRTQLGSDGSSQSLEVFRVYMLWPGDLPNANYTCSRSKEGLNRVNTWEDNRTNIWIRLFVFLSLEGTLTHQTLSRQSHCSSYCSCSHQLLSRL